MRTLDRRHDCISSIRSKIKVKQCNKMHNLVEFWQPLVTMRKSGQSLTSGIRRHQRARKLVFAKSLNPSFVTLATEPACRTYSDFSKEPGSNTQASLTWYCFSEGVKGLLKKKKKSNGFLLPQPHCPLPLCSVQKKNPSAAMVVFIKFSSIKSSGRIY